jgi:hypothetical protein
MRNDAGYRSSNCGYAVVAEHRVTSTTHKGKDSDSHAEFQRQGECAGVRIRECLMGTSDCTQLSHSS